MAAGKDGVARTIALEEGEFALIIGQQGETMSVRIEEATELDDNETDIPIPGLLAVALATRLLRDPEFHDDVLDWYDQHGDEDEEEEEGEGGH